MSITSSVSAWRVSYQGPVFWWATHDGLNKLRALGDRERSAIICAEIVLLLLLSPILATGGILAGLAERVIKITDGDTITILYYSFNQHKIRLTVIDAPEREQPFRAVSRQNLTDLVFGEQVIVGYED